MRIIAIFLCVLFIPLLLIELTLGHHFNGKARSDGFTCTSEAFGRHYCPDTDYVGFPAAGEGFFSRLTRIGSNGERAVSNPVKDGERVYILHAGAGANTAIRDKHRFTAQLAAAGWNIVEYMHPDWVAANMTDIARKLPLRQGDQVIIIAETEDFITASPARPNTPEDEIKTAGKLGFTEKLRQRSFLLNAFKKRGEDTENKNIIERDFLDIHANQCRDIPSVDAVGLHMHHAIMLSHNERCWSQGARIAAEQGVLGLQQLDAFLQAREIGFTVFITPAPWQFYQENTSNRHGIPSQNRVSMSGLFDYLTRHLNGLRLIEPLMAERKDGANSLFMPVSGSWTQTTHEVLTQTLLDTGMER